MSAFLQWYVSMLKRRPMLTNIGSAVVLMTTGDVMAQELEHHQDVISDKMTFWGDKKKERDEKSHPPKDTEKPKLSLKRYGTVNPKIAEAQAMDAYEKTKHKHSSLRHHPNHLGGGKRETSRSTTTTTEKKKEQNKDDPPPSPQLPDIQETMDQIKETIMDTLDQLQEDCLETLDTLQAEFEFIDGWRVTTMVVWSGAIFTPIYVQIYRLFDYFLPHKTPISIFWRVVWSFIISIPMNAGFFSYGTFVHHTAEWMAMQREWQLELADMGISTDDLYDIFTNHQYRHYGSVFPYDWKIMMATARLKLESELVQTVLDSGKIWIPINTINFTMMPPHLRPLVLLTFGLFWNAYLSLAQHRDVPLPEEEEDEDNNNNSNET